MASRQAFHKRRVPHEDPLRWTLASQHVSQYLPDSSSHLSCSDVSSTMLLTFEMLQQRPGGLFELPERNVAIHMAARHDVALHSINRT